MDLGSELGQNEDVKTLLIKHGYDIQPTRPNASYHNSPAKRLHETIDNTMRSILESAGLPEIFGVMP
eukprot:5270824-Ditylum_brightwellii.AAC.1